jgi:hypothetical protein
MAFDMLGVSFKVLRLNFRHEMPVSLLVGRQEAPSFHVA